jgi:hypothetical protein
MKKIFKLLFTILPVATIASISVSCKTKVSKLPYATLSDIKTVDDYYITQAQVVDLNRYISIDYNGNDSLEQIFEILHENEKDPLLSITTCIYHKDFDYSLINIDKESTSISENIDGTYTFKLVLIDNNKTKDIRTLKITLR